MPAVLNASNEIAVAAFLEGKISFPEIVSVVSEDERRRADPAPREPRGGRADRFPAREQASAILRRRAHPVAT